MIHRYKKKDYNVVIDGNSGSIHIVDDLAYDIIGHYDKILNGDECTRDSDKGRISMLEHRLQSEINVEKLSEIIFENIRDKHENVSINDVVETVEDVQELRRSGKLFSDDEFKTIAENMKSRLLVLKAICLHVAHDCNMNCQYCFAGEGEYCGTRGLMSFETAKNAIDFLVENSTGRRNLEVDFFGGEPLLNWEVCKKTVEYARSIEDKKDKNFRFTLTTNGLLIDDDVIEFANREMSNVVLSLDGRKEINDRMRKMKNGLGTYDIVVDKFKKLVDKRGNKDYYIRGTYTKNNLDFTQDILHMAELGFRELSMEPVVAEDGENYAIDRGDLDIIFENYDELSEEMVKRYGSDQEFYFYHYTVDFTGGPCIAKRLSGCGVGTEYLAITPDGELFPCHQFVGDKEFLLGTLETGIVKKDVIDKFKNCNVYSHDECQDCFAKLYCSGGCSANAYHKNGDIEKVYEMSCEIHKKRIENAIVMELEKQKNDNSV